MKNPWLTLRTLRCGALTDHDPVFWAAQRAYPEFSQWYRKAVAEGRRMYVAMDRDVPLGAAILKLEGRHLKLCCLSVKDKRRGEGAGRLLMEQFIQDAKDFGLEPYFTAKRDPAIEKFAAAMGFFEVGRIGGDPHYVPIDLPKPWEAPVE